MSKVQVSMRMCLILATVSMVTAPAGVFASVTVFDVHAYAHSSNAGAGAGLDTGIDLAVGDLLHVSADPLDAWSAGAACRTSGPDGLGPSNPYGCVFPCYVNSGASFRFGALVGRIGGGSFFLIGSSYERVRQIGGRLRLYYWDSNYSDNSGFITATVEVNEAPTGVGIPYNDCVPDDSDGDGVPDDQDVCPGGDDTLDTDGDLIPDDCDACPNSDLNDTIVIDGCDTEVANMMLGDDGCTMADRITECAEGATTHGEFVSCVAQVTNDWKQEGLISGKEKGRIQSCAAQGNLWSECQTDADCDDGLFCNGVEVCLDGTCVVGDPCPGQSCDEEYDECVD